VEERSAKDQQALRAAVAEIAPELAAAWPTYRDLNVTLAGVAARRDNFSEIWGWLGSYDVGRGYAAPLFHDVRVAAVPILLEHAAAELNAIARHHVVLDAAVAPTAPRAGRREPRPSPAAWPTDPLKHRRLPGDREAHIPHLTVSPSPPTG
jgi:hypothetical protein